MATNLRAYHPDFNKRLVKALGLDGQLVTGITIKAEANSPVEVTITMLVQQEEVDGLIEAIETNTCLSKCQRDHPLLHKTYANLDK